MFSASYFSAQVDTGHRRDLGADTYLYFHSDINIYPGQIYTRGYDEISVKCNYLNCMLRRAGGGPGGEFSGAHVLHGYRSGWWKYQRAPAVAALRADQRRGLKDEWQMRGAGCAGRFWPDQFRPEGHNA